MPQIQRIPDQPAGCPVGDAEYTAEFCGGEGCDRGGAVPAQPDRVFGAGQLALRNRVAGVQVGPMPSDVEAAGFGGDQGVFVGLRRGQGCGRIQLDQIIIFEHALNILVDSDTPHRSEHVATNGQHLTDADNTAMAGATVGPWGHVGMRGLPRSSSDTLHLPGSAGHRPTRRYGPGCWSAASSP
jgi:hypothetical protein